MGHAPCIRRAEASEAALLTDIAIRSKAYWGYSSEFMAACRHELLVSASDIADPDRICFVCETDVAVTGYVALARIDGQVWEVDALFVEPAHMGQGRGRALMEYALAALSERGGSRVIIQSDPNAADFYQSIGGTRIGEKESGSIPGRYLPMLEIVLDSEQGA